jgi:hypothetical protein
VRKGFEEEEGRWGDVRELESRSGLALCETGRSRRVRLVYVFAGLY